jgi:pilus assembly protein Flp/PilA
MRMSAKLGSVIPALWRFADDVSGATAIEYAIVACSIAAAVAVAVTKLGSNTNSLFTSVSNLLH